MDGVDATLQSVPMVCVTIPAADIVRVGMEITPQLHYLMHGMEDSRFIPTEETRKVVQTAAAQLRQALGDDLYAAITTGRVVAQFVGNLGQQRLELSGAHELERQLVLQGLGVMARLAVHKMTETPGSAWDAPVDINPVTLYLYSRSVAVGDTSEIIACVRFAASLH